MKRRGRELLGGHLCLGHSLEPDFRYLLNLTCAGFSVSQFFCLKCANERKTGETHEEDVSRQFDRIV